MTDELDTSLSSQLRQLQTLVELSGVINSSLDISDVRRRAIEAATLLTNASAASLLFIDEETGGLYFDVALGDRGEMVKNVQVPRGQGVAGWVVDQKIPVIINDAQHDPRVYKGADKKSGFVTRNMLCVPVVTKTRLIGVLQAINKRTGDFTAADQSLLVALANQIAVAMENVRLYDEVKDNFYSVVHVLGEATEKRDPFTNGHAKRVANFCMVIGRMMGLSRKELLTLKLGSILHDVGMIGISDAVIQKRNRLSPGEYQIVMRHVTYGQEILEHVKMLRDIIPIIRYHHEFYNGTGFLGKRGEQIPLLARIVALADALDAMRHERPYRQRLTPKKIVAEVEALSGTQFDPDIVDVFLRSTLVADFNID
ncbi:MAG: GAF domain-containing protein [Gammaproteobacteria bacterium]|nr:GAF domain-containing protein [Gammaproteobacteria bacterium]